MQLRNSTLAWSAVGLLAVGAATGLSAHGVLKVASPATTPVSSDSNQPASSQPIPMMTAPNYRAIVSRNQAAVVGITTAGPMTTAGPQEFNFGGPNGDDNPFSQFFRGQMPRPHGMQHAQGSGFLISADGLVLTNAHVVDGAKEVTVKLSDHREYKAKVLGADKSSDIAVLKIDAHNLPAVTLGDSDKLGVGDYVLAIGEPFGLEETATAGIVSAKGRSLPGDGFAIPINLAVQVKDQLVKTGKVAHSRLGVEVQTLNQSLADSFKLNSPNGALVAKVVPDSAAAEAGIKVGDVILKFNGTPIIDAGSLSQHVGTATPGEKATIQIWRNGKALDLTATIGNAATLAAAGDDSAGDSSQAKLGLALRPLRPEERQQAGVPGGLVVEDAQGRAAEAGIQQGDVVLSVDGTPVQTVEQLRKMVKDHDKQIALLIQRGDARLFVPVTLG